jgi:phosphate-selective porin OprO/OprP
MMTTLLTNPDLWTNRVWATNLGVNWYLNRYVKAVFDWQHNEFGNPVFYGQPDRKSLTNNIFWMRVQFYF